MSSLETPRGRELGAWLGALLLHLVALGLVRNHVGSGEARQAASMLPVPASSNEFDVEFGEGTPLAPGAQENDNEPRLANSNAPVLAKRVTRAPTRDGRL